MWKGCALIGKEFNLYVCKNNTVGKKRGGRESKKEREKKKTMRGKKKETREREWKKRRRETDKS